MVLALVRGLPALGFDVAVATVMGLGPLEAPVREAGAEVRCLGRRRRAPGVAAVARGAAWVRGGGFDLVHTHLFAGDTWGRLAALAGGARATVSTAHNTDLDEDGPVHRAAGAVLARVTDRVVAVSRAVAEHAVARGIPRDRVRVIANGADPARVPRPSAPLLPDPARPRLAAIGRLAPQKGMEDAIDALALLLPRFPGAELTVAGEGPLLGALVRRAERAGVQDRARFVGRVEDVGALLAETDLLMHPARWEGFGLVLVEAALAGVPAVATAVGGIPEVLDAPRTGLLVPPGSPSALAGATAALLSDPGALRAAGEAARARALALHTEERMVADYAALYRELLR